MPLCTVNEVENVPIKVKKGYSFTWKLRVVKAFLEIYIYLCRSLETHRLWHPIKIGCYLLTEMNIGEVAHARQNENKFSFVLACSQHCQTFFETAVSWHPIKIGCYLLTEMNIGEVAHARQNENKFSFVLACSQHCNRNRKFPLLTRVA